MSMDRTSTIQSLTADILRQVDEADTAEKTAAEALPTYKSELAKELQKTAAELRSLAKSCGEVSYDDLRAFAARVGGVA